MKMNGPVDCKCFFADQIKSNEEGLWCVSLKPNGQILSLIEAKSASTGDFTQVAETLRRDSQKHLHLQIVVARCNPRNLIFDEYDWENVKYFKEISHCLELEFVDYIKVKKEGYCNLLNFDY